MINLYNDNELLYLISERDDDAFTFLYNKYIPLIYIRLRAFKISKRNYEDFFQECQIMLVKAIETYKPTLMKTFNRYFDLIMTRRIIDILRSEKNYYYSVTLKEDMSEFFDKTLTDVMIIERPREFSLLSETEKRVYIERYEKGFKPESIALNLGLTAKQVYNTIIRIKGKIKIK